MPPLLCPECNRAAVIRSRRRSLLDFLLAIFGMYPYRCSLCMHRFRSFGSGGERRSEPQDDED